MTKTTIVPLEDGYFAGYMLSHLASYAKANKIAMPQITIGIYHEDGGTTGEFTIYWENLGDEISPRLEMWDDAWQLMDQIPALFKALAHYHGENPPWELVVDILKGLGFKDHTDYAKPHKLDDDDELTEEEKLFATASANLVGKKEFFAYRFEQYVNDKNITFADLANELDIHTWKEFYLLMLCKYPNPDSDDYQRDIEKTARWVDCNVERLSGALRYVIDKYF